MPRRDGPSAGPADDARSTSASPEGRGQDSATSAAAADRGEKSTGPSRDRDDSGAHGAQRPKVVEEAAALVVYEGPLDKAQTWQSFKYSRDADFAGRFSMEERFAHATRDLDVDHEVASAERRFREDTPDLAAHLPADGTAVRDVIKGFREDLHDSFSSAWEKSAGRPEGTDEWSKSYTRLRHELPERFAQVSLQHREIRRMETALNDAAGRFGEKDLFGGNYLPKERFEENAIKFDEVTETFSVDYEKAGPYGKLRLDLQKDVIETVNSAWRDAGGLPADEAARKMENDLGQIRAGLHERLEHLSNQERHVQHGERVLDQANNARENPLSGDGLDRVRKEFGDEIRSRYNELHQQAAGRKGWFDHAWEAADEHLRSTDALHNRLDYGEFREEALQQGRRALEKAVTRANGEGAGGDFGGAYVSPEAEERLTAEWTKAVEKAVDDHWSSMPGRDFRGTGPRESMRSSADDDAVSSRGSVRSFEETDDAGFHEGLRMSWEERFQQLSDTLPQRIEHEFDKSIVLRQAADDFERIAGHPDDLSAGHTVTQESFEKLSGDFRNDTVTEYDRLWGPEGTDTKAWLEHEAEHEGVFDTTVTALREAPFRPGGRGPGEHAEESAAGGTTDPRPPDDDTSGHAAPSSDVRPSPTAASADRPVPEAGARTAEPGRSDAGQVHAQAVRERPVSSSVRSPGSRKEGLGAGGAGETSREPAGERDLAGTPESSETTPSELVDDLTRVLTRVGEAAAVREQAYKIFQTQLEARYPDPRTRPAESDVDQVREWFANRWAGEAVAAGGSEHLTPATQERLRFALTRRLPAGTRSPADDRLQQRHEREFRVALSAENGTDHANPDPTWDRTTTELFHQLLDRIRERYVANRRPLGEDRDDPGDSDQAVQARAARKEQVEQLKQVAAKAATRLRSRMEPMGAAVRDFTERTRDLSAHAARDQALKRDPALFRWYRQQQADIVRRFSDALELHGLGARERLEHAFEQRITALRDEAWSRREANREFGRVVERVGLQELATPAARTWATARVEEARERFIQDYLDWRATVPRERQERAATAAHPAQPDAQEPASASAETSGAVDSPVVADHVSAGSEPARVEETRASASAETAAAAHSPAVARPALTAEARARLGEAQRHFIEEQRARIGTAIDRAARSFAQNPRGPLTRRFNVADGAASAPVLSAVRGQLQRGFDDLIARETSARKMLYPGTDSIDERIAAMKARINGPLDRLVRGIGWAIEREAAREASVAKARATVDAAASTWQTDVLAQSPALRDRLGVQATVPADVLRAVRDRFVVRAEARFDALFERDSENRTATAERSAEQLEESLKDDESLLHGWFLRPVAGRALVTEAARAFDRQFDAFDPGHEIDRGQLAGLRNAFTAHAGAVFESIFNGVTTDPAELTARIWEWEDRLNGLSGELADLVGFEPAPMEEPRAAAAPLHGLSDGHDVGTVAQDELSTKDRDDRASAGDVEAPMRELADVDAAREPLGQQSVVEVEAPARGAQDAGESKAGGPASADVAEQEVSDLGTARRLLGEQSEARYKQVMREARSIVRERSGQLPSMSDLDGAVSKIDRVRILTAAWIVREGVTRVAGDGRANEFVDSLLQIGTPASADGAEREGSDLDEGRRLLSKQPLAGYDAAMSAAREIIGARGGTSSERDPGGHVSDVNRAWILKQEQFTADVIALAAQEKVRLHSLPAEGREQLLAMAGQIIAHHHEPLPIDMTAVSAERRAKHEAVLQLVAGYMHDIAWTAVIRDKKTVDEAEAMAEASGDEMASLLADALGTRRRTGGAPPGGSRPPVDLVEIGGGGESSGAIRQRLDEDAAAEPPSYVDRPGSPDQVSDMAARWGIPLEQATRLSRYLWFDDELFESALAQAGLVGNATHMAEFVEEIGRIPYDLKMIARRLRPTVMGAREVYLVSRTFGMDPRYLKAFRGELGDLRPLPNESNLEEVRLYFENLLSSDQLARIGELCYRTGISVGDLKRFLDGQPQVQGENALTIGDLLALDVLDAFEWVDSQRFAHPSGAASAAGELEAAAAIVRGALPGELLESTPGAAAVAEGIPVGKISDGWYRDVLAQVHAVLSENDVDFDTRSRWARNRARRLVGLRDVSGAVGRAQGQGPNPSLVTSNETGRSFDQDMEEAAARVGIELEEFGAVLLQAVHNEGLGPDEVMRLPMDQLAHLTSETLEELRRETASIPGMSVADAAWIVEEFGVELEQFWVFGAQLRAIFGNSDLPLDGRMEQVREMFASLPGVRVEDGYIDITHFITIAVRAGISAEDLSALLVLGTYPGEEPELGEFLVIPRDDLREQVAEVLPHLRRAAEELAPMSLKDVAWVCVEGAVAPEDIWVFGRELRRIFLAVPGTDFSGMSQEEYRRQQVRDMFRAVPGALTEDGSIDVSAFAQMASHASVSADVLRAFLAWKGGYAKERSIALEDMDPDALSDEVDEYLTMLQEAAESLAPMSVDDVAWICAQTGIRPRDLKVFDRGLRGVYSRTPDTGPSHPDLESLRTGGLRAVLARPLEAFEVLRAYANMQDVAEFAAIAARLGIDADAMRAIVEAARHDMNLVRRVFRYELLDLVAEVRGTQSGGPSHTFDHSAWFEQARDTVQGLPERERLLAAAGEIVAAHHEPLPVDVTTVSTERRAQHEGVVYAVAERLHLLGYKADRAADGGVDHVVREAANALSRRLAVEFGTQRRTGGAPPGGFRPPVDLVEIGGGGASSGLRAGMAADRAGVLPAGMREGDLEWAGSSHSAGPFCVQVAVVGGDRLRGGRARRC